MTRGNAINHTKEDIFFEVIDYYLFRLRSNGSVISNRRRLE